MRRNSRPNPYILPSLEIEDKVTFLKPATEQAIVAALGITIDDWHALGTPMKAKHIIDFEMGRLRASEMPAPGV